MQQQKLQMLLHLLKRKSLEYYKKSLKNDNPSCTKGVRRPFPVFVFHSASLDISAENMHKEKNNFQNENWNFTDNNDMS